MSLLASAMLLSGCVQYAHKASDMQSLLLVGDIAAASEMAEQQDPDEHDVLASLNKGMLRRMLHKYEASNRIFEKAKQKIDELYGVSISEQLGAVTVNDTLRQYQGARYEQVLLHAYMAMNYIELGDLDGARVEMLQADVKMREWGEQPDDNPFVRYLSGIIYEMLGETDQALVSYRQAVKAYAERADARDDAVPAQLKADLLRLLQAEGLQDERDDMLQRFQLILADIPEPLRSQGEVVLVLSNGLAPVRGETVIQTFAVELNDVVRIALPAYLQPKPPVKAARALANAASQHAFETAEDVDALARLALQQDMPAILARAVARAVVKHQTQDKVEERGGALAGFIATVANLVTERADTRSWTSLPAEIQISRFTLPPGSHTIVIEILNRAQHVIDRIEHEVSIQPGQTVLLSPHWIAPAPVAAKAH